MYDTSMSAIKFRPSKQLGLICRHSIPLNLGRFLSILGNQCQLAVSEGGTPQPLYNTIVGVQVNFRVSYPIRVITRVKCIVI